MGRIHSQQTHPNCSSTVLNNSETAWEKVLWPDKTKSSFLATRPAPVFGGSKILSTTQRTHPHCEVQRWKHYAQGDFTALRDQFMGLWTVKSWMTTSFLKPERWRWVWMSLLLWQPRRSAVGSFGVLASLQTSVEGAKASSYQAAIKNPKGFREFL